jgi:hypothetical protein
MLIVVFFVLCLEPIADSDTFLHLATGRAVLAGRIPAADPFSHTIAGKEWLAHEWLAASIMELGHRAGGLALLVWINAALAAGVLLLVAHRYTLAGVSSRIARLAALLTAGVAVKNVVLVRPHMATVACVALTAVILDRDREGRRPAPLVLLPVMFAFWANCHGGFILGGLPFIVAVIDSAVEAARGAPGAGSRTRRLIACGLACLAAACVNPHGPALLAFPFQFDPGASFLALVDEWQPPDYRRAHAQELLLLALFGAALAGPARSSPGTVAGALASLHFALGAMRNQFLLAIFVTPLMARCLEAAIAGGGWTRLGLLDARLHARARGKGTLLPLAIAAVVALPWLARRDLVDRSRFPRAAVEWIGRSDARGQLFNEYDHGGYVLWALGRRMPVFIDGRIEIYHRHGVLPEYLAAVDARAGWRAVLDRHRVNTALVSVKSPICRALAADPAWKRAFEQDGSAVFVRERPLPALEAATPGP